MIRPKLDKDFAEFQKSKIEIQVTGFVQILAFLNEYGKLQSSFPDLGKLGKKSRDFFFFQSHNN